MSSDERLVGVRRHDDRVEAVSRAVAGRQLDAVGVAPDGPRAEARVDAAGEPGEQRVDVAAAAAGDGAPAEPAEAEHAVMVEEADRVRRGEVERPIRGGRPQRGGQRHQEVAPKTLRVAPPVGVFAEGHRLAGLGERPARRSEPARDLEQKAVEARTRQVAGLGERPAARPFEAAAATRHRERHLGVLRAHVELAEEAVEQRVVRHVVDDEADVEREPVVLDGVHVAAGAGVLLEQLDLVTARQDVGGAQAGDARSDHGDPHRGSLRAHRLSQALHTSGILRRGGTFGSLGGGGLAELGEVEQPTLRGAATPVKRLPTPRGGGATQWES